MRDGEGNRLSPEEHERVRSIQGDPGSRATTKVSIDPAAERDTGDADKPQVKPDGNPKAGAGE